MSSEGPMTYSHDYDENSRLDMLSIELEKKLGQCIIDRSLIDVRMVEDLRNYHGEYDSEFIKAAKENKRATTFVKLTRAKTNAAESQLVDLLFPNDDKNWGIDPTPDPELAARSDSQKAVDINGEQFETEQGEVVTEGMLAKRELEMIKERCIAMRDLIHDQLVEANYNTKSRLAIHDACVIGTGVLKGPVVVGKLDRAYTTDENGNWVLSQKESFTASVEAVRPWDFYPDMSASSISECEFAFERRYMSKQQILELPQRRGFSKAQVQRVLAMAAVQTQHRSSYQDDVRKLAGLSDTLNDTRYETWEYNGPISNGVLFDLGVIKQDENESDEEFNARLDDDVIATVFYCGGIVLGARTHMMTYNGYLPYRVYNWEKDDSCLFGYGVPRMCRDEQAIINTVWRMILDNGSITAGPQMAHNRKLIKPENGEWTIEPFKQWELFGGATDIKQAMSTFEFQSRLPELQAIYQTARILFDEVTGVPMMQQGEQGPATQTLGGMSMLMNAANTVRRRQVKAWDDDITKPIISDFYHYNMMHHDDNSIKGDYQVQARGTGALLVRETQTLALTNFLNMASSSEIFAPVLRLKAMEILRMWARNQQLPKDIIPTEDELKAFEEQQSKNQVQDPQIEIEQLRLQQAKEKQAHEQAMLERKLQSDQLLAEQNREVKLQEIAAKIQEQSYKERMEIAKLAQLDKVNTEKLMVDLEKTRTQNEQNWQQFLAELKVKQSMGKNANFGLD